MTKEQKKRLLKAKIAVALRACLVRVRVIAKEMGGGRDVRVVGSVAALQ